MAGLCWIAVVLVFFLSAEDSLAAVDQNWLTSITEGIENEYALGDTFSLAVNVPQGQDPNDLQQVFQDDPAEKVKQTLSQGQVYQGTRVVAAAQSVSRVLQNLQRLIKSSQGNFLIIYSEESPCGTSCTNEDGIHGKTNNVIQNWGGYAFVFSKVGDVPGTDTSQLSNSFKQLEISKLGLDNIFRCSEPGDDPFQCTSCSSGGDVAPSCLINNAPPDQVVSMGTDEGESTGIGEGISTGIGEGISAGIGRRRSKADKEASAKGVADAKEAARRGRKRGKSGKVAKKCKRRGGCKLGGRRRKGGRMKKRGKQNKRGKGRKRGKSRRGRRGKGKKRKRGGRKSSKRRRGSKRRKWGKRRG